MDIGTSVTVIIILLIMVLTVDTIYKRRLTHDERLDANVAADEERNLILSMAEKGYVQVPVLKQHFQKSRDGKDKYGDGENTVSNDRHWQLAWMKPEQAEIALLSDVGEREDGQDVIREWLDPT